MSRRRKDYPICEKRLLKRLANRELSIWCFKIVETALEDI